SARSRRSRSPFGSACRSSDCERGSSGNTAHPWTRSRSPRSRRMRCDAPSTRRGHESAKPTSVHSRSFVLFGAGYSRRVRSRPLCAGSIGGVLAVAAGVAGTTSQAARGGSASAITWVTLAFVTVAGMVALARPRVVEALVVADALVAISLLIEVFGRLGRLYLPGLLFLVFVTRRGGERAEVEVAGHVTGERILAWA